MPKFITKIEYHGNIKKTTIVNMVDVAEAFRRSASHITKYFGYMLGTESKFDKKTKVSIVMGSHNTEKLTGLLENFIKEYVQCNSCGKLETKLLITKTQMIQLECIVCGFVSDVDMRHIHTSFYREKHFKDEKAMRRAEKQRLKEGEAADTVMKKPEKDVKKPKDGHRRTTTSKKIGNGSDEDHVSLTVSQAGDKDEVLDLGTLMCPTAMEAFHLTVSTYHTKS